MYTTAGEYTEWHLTPNGWERGTQVTDSGKKIKSSPENRVLTLKYEEHMSSTLKLNTRCEQTWSNKNEEQINKLIAEFGECPCSL
ncbi:hypothetical protein [Sulfurimonas xiamenensis]|uniref:Uncharacterized protein n=1 Tax=Sulfurimonas xiamenensis TaxID=2590021 RepID=A0AAJ4A4T6_9BACT|nr:hypothetical protein [Sulfurimonas xiamenensis]QFR43753.1 hypothetical protein FJR47_07455 [Sulfurimonas xiamenensis]